MVLTLDGCWAKVVHAEQHLETLGKELIAWVQGRPYAIGIQHDANAEQHMFSFTLTDVFEAPSQLGLVFGDYVHNLRSALDHLVWALAVNNKGGKEPKNANAVGFPVADNPEAFYDAPVLRYLTWEQATVLESFQPYRGGDAPNPLRDLNLFWNDDKHRLVLPVLARVKRMPVFRLTDVERVDSEWFEAKKPLEPNTLIARVIVTSSGPKTNVEVESIPVAVAFGKRRRLTEENVPTLRDVARDIIHSCERFFI